MIVLTRTTDAQKLSCLAMPDSRLRLEIHIASIEEASRHSSSRQQWPAACCK